MAQQRGVISKKARSELSSRSLLRRSKLEERIVFNVAFRREEKAARQTHADRRSVNTRKFSVTLAVYSRTAGQAGTLTIIRHTHTFSAGIFYLMFLLNASAGFVLRQHFPLVMSAQHPLNHTHTNIL